MHVSAMAEYYIETGKPSSALLDAMGDKLCKGLEAANNVNTGTTLIYQFVGNGPPRSASGS
jgi:hypothetical protein